MLQSSAARATTQWNILTAGVGISCIHQIGLSYFKYEAVVIGSDRGNFFLQNKEGICSTIGFLAIYFLAAFIGSWAMKTKGLTAHKYVMRRGVYFFATICVVGWWLGHPESGYEVMFPRPSRRMANAGYVLWVVAHSAGLLFLLLLVDYVCPVVTTSSARSTANLESESLILSKINRHQLKVFMLANLCTGAVNISIKTLDVENMQALLIMVGYLFVVTSVAVKFL
jgi:glucosaminylphosphatidylinositol acyltransferase